MEKKKSINHFETEWSWGNIVTIMADNCGIVQIYFENGYHYGLIEGLNFVAVRGLFLIAACVGLL